MENQKNRSKEIVRTGIIGIVSNVVLVAAKVTVGVLASSVSIISDAVNNLTDAMSGVVTVAGTKLSEKKPDRKHPFGHGRIEFVASAIIGMLIFIAGAMAIYESVVSLIQKDEPTYSTYSFIIISIAVVVKIALGLYYRHKGKQVNSDVLKASGLDALWDSLLSLGTLIGAIVSRYTGIHLEGYIGIVIGLLIVKSSIEVLKEAISKIVGERTEADFASELIKDVSAIDGVSGVYDLIVNNYGEGRNVGSLHVEVPQTYTAKDIQRLERKIAYLCYEKYHTVMTVGVYAKPEDGDFEQGIRKQILDKIKDHPEVLQTHGFYVDEKDKVVSIDVIISFDCADVEGLYAHLRDEITALFPDYTVYLILDKDFSLT